MLIAVALLVGAVVALVIEPDVAPEQARYVTVVVLAALDAVLGGVRAHLERTFSDRVFAVEFVTTATMAVALVWIGEQLDTDLLTAVAVVLGFRIFQHLAAARRRMLGG